MGKYNIQIDQGASFSFQAQVKNSSGVPIPLTGSTFAGKIREYPGAADVLATFTIAIDGTLNYAINVSLTDTQTAALPAPTTADNPEAKAQYWYDIEWTDSGGIKKRLLHGSVDVSPEVTY